MQLRSLRSAKDFQKMWYETGTWHFSQLHSLNSVNHWVKSDWWKALCACDLVIFLVAPWRWPCPGTGCWGGRGHWADLRNQRSDARLWHDLQNWGCTTLVFVYFAWTTGIDHAHTVYLSCTLFKHTRHPPRQLTLSYVSQWHFRS